MFRPSRADSRHGTCRWPCRLRHSTQFRACTRPRHTRWRSESSSRLLACRSWTTARWVTDGRTSSTEAWRQCLTEWDAVGDGTWKWASRLARATMRPRLLEERVFRAPRSCSPWPLGAWAMLDEEKTTRSVSVSKKRRWFTRNYYIWFGSKYESDFLGFVRKHGSYFTDIFQEIRIHLKVFLFTQKINRIPN